MSKDDDFIQGIVIILSCIAVVYYWSEIRFRYLVTYKYINIGCYSEDGSIYLQIYKPRHIFNVASRGGAHKNSFILTRDGYSINSSSLGITADYLFKDSIRFSPNDSSYAFILLGGGERGILVENKNDMHPTLKNIPLLCFDAIKEPE